MPYINGQQVLLPSVQIGVTDQAFAAGATAPVTGLLLIGPANDGVPNTIQTFTSPSQAILALNSGDLLQGILNAFAGSTNAPVVNQLDAIQVNPLTQATSSIPGTGSGPAFDLTTTHYGAPANTAQWQLNAGTLLGYQFQQQQLATQAGGGTYQANTHDNIGINALNLWYTGTGTSPTVTITDSVFTVAATTSDTGGTVDLSSSLTLTQLAQQISALTGWNAVVTASNGQQTTAAFFDNVSAGTVSTVSTSPTVITAHGFALAAYLAANPVYFTGVRPANCMLLTTSNSWTVASGATSPAATNTNWQDAYTTAQSAIGIGVVTPISPSVSIWDMNDAHCHYMATVGAGREGYVGDSVGATLATEQTNAATLNSDRTALVWPGLQGTDYNGHATTFGAYVSSAPQLASMRAASPATRALTGRTVSATGLELPVTSATAAQANASGVIALYADEITQGAPTISWDRTTWQASGPVDKIEMTMMVEKSILIQDFQAVAAPFIGPVASGGDVGSLAADLYNRALYWYTQGLIVVEPSPNAIQLTAANGIISGTMQIQIGEPTNYIALTLTLQNGVIAAAA